MPSTPRTFPDQSQSPGVDNPPVDTASQRMDDNKFVKDAALGGMTEVEWELAREKASTNEVKQFAQRMIDDHSKANDQLKQLAAKQNLHIPSSLDNKHQSRVDKLAKLSGDKFDKAYLKDQLKDHESDVSEFSAEAKNGSDPNVKAFAAQHCLRCNSIWNWQRV